MGGPISGTQFSAAVENCSLQDIVILYEILLLLQWLPVKNLCQFLEAEFPTS